MSSVGVGRRAAGTARTLLAASHPEPALAVTAVTVGLAVASGRSAAGVVAAAAAVAAGQLAIGWHNDWLDVERDRRAARTDKPLASGTLTSARVGQAWVVALAACVPLSLLSGVPAGLAHLVAVALAFAYNARLKATVLSWVPFAASFALLVAFVSLGLPGAPWPPWWGLVAGGLLGVGAHLVNTVPDLEADTAAGIRGLPHHLGRARSVTLAALLLLVASAVVTFGPGRPGAAVVGLAVAAVLVGVAVVAGSRGMGRWSFRAAMGVALVDVALLVSRGHLR